MNNPLVFLGSIVGLAIAVPVFLSVVSYDGIEAIQNESTLNNPKKKIISYETVDKESPSINIYNHKINKTEKMDIEKYLCGVLAGEMPVDFNIEALKAQAVAARTYVMYKENQGKSNKHSNAVVCTDYNHCQEYKNYEELKEKNGQDWMDKYYPKIQQAVRDTKGQIITYKGEPILTLYFSTSSGKTENCEEVFAQAYPYLQSVESPYDKEYSPKYTSELKISNKDFLNTINSNYKNVGLNSSNLKNQIKILNRSDGGSVDKIKIGNKEIRGRDIRSIFKLNSSNFELKFGENHIDFLVKGYGHGVGMSQWGAQGMAEEGYQYYEILNHYYQETDITDLY